MGKLPKILRMTKFQLINGSGRWIVTFRYDTGAKEEFEISPRVYKAFEAIMKRPDSSPYEMRNWLMKNYPATRMSGTPFDTIVADAIKGKDVKEILDGSGS